jgi:NAD(P)-dependent dehydrogenase (short-subunit alcohol dehydrogenase family)
VEPSLSDLHGKTCLVTGASSGIGRAAAHALARLGPELVFVCRDRERGERAVEDVRKGTGNERISLLLADLSRQAEVRRLAEEYRASGRPLHVLLNNAGVLMQRRTETADGLETTFAVNHLAYFLLTRLLLDRIRASAPARIVNVASDAHGWAGGRLDFDDLHGRRRYSPMRAYGKSKLANILFTRELARRLAGTGVTANAMHPGFVGSNFARNNGALAALAMSLVRPFARSPEKGAETAVYLCASPDVEGVTGQYFQDLRPKWPKRFAQNDEDARRLWEVSERLTGLA